tara:strand:+ start:221 stop:1117 length:897 start_codon:yes stop_codon:yes gene_type:complete
MNSKRQTGTNLHVPVMPKEVLSYLNIKPNGVYLDGTIGLGGHSNLIMKQLSLEGHLIGVDRDKEALSICNQRLSTLTAQFSLFHNSYNNFNTILNNMGISKVNGILLDLGMSSLQLDSKERGFSYKTDSKLDMRFDISQDIKASNILNQLPTNELANLIYQYGEERRSRPISKSIVRLRPIKTVFDLVEAIRRSTPPNHRNKSISRVFQAIRIKVNEELDKLENFLSFFYEKIAIGGRIVIISFHSLEDRQVKHQFKRLAKEQQIKILTKKPLVPSKKEILENKRSASAKMRVAERIK